MYLQGTFIGENGTLSINSKTSKKEVEDFLKSNPSVKSRITDKKLIKEQCQLMGIEYVEESKPKKRAAK